MSLPKDTLFTRKWRDEHPVEYAIACSMAREQRKESQRRRRIIRRMAAHEFADLDKEMGEIELLLISAKARLERIKKLRAIKSQAAEDARAIYLQRLEAYNKSYTRRHYRNC